MARYADVQGALRRYPEVTDAERIALKNWYRRARFSEFLPALSDPTVEVPLGRLRRDLLLGAGPRLTSLGASSAAPATS